MTLYLIRHGSTLANEQRLYCGSTDLPLSAAGRQGILTRAANSVYPEPSGLKLHSSGLLRTVETLRLIYGDRPQTALPGFREMDFGAFEMKGYEELKLDPAYIRWIEDESGDTPCPGGESATGFRQRVDRATDTLLLSPASALLCCHGGVIAHIMGRLFPEEPRHFYQWQPRPGEGYALDTAQGTAVAWRPLDGC